MVGPFAPARIPIAGSSLLETKKSPTAQFLGASLAQTHQNRVGATEKGTPPNGTAERDVAVGGGRSGNRLFPARSGLITNPVSTVAGVLAAGFGGLLLKSLSSNLPAEERVYRGFEAEPHTWPWIAKIKVNFPGAD